MKRRNLLKASGLAAVGVLSRGVVAGERRRPNLLVIHTDEHNFRTLGCYRATMDPEQALMWGDAVVKGADAKSFTTDRLADKTVDFISANKDKPFCYYMVSIPDPHSPDTARRPYDTMYEQQKYNQPRTFDVEVTRRQKQYGPTTQREKGPLSLFKHLSKNKIISKSLTEVSKERAN